MFPDCLNRKQNMERSRKDRKKRQEAYEFHRDIKLWLIFYYFVIYYCYVYDYNGYMNSQINGQTVVSTYSGKHGSCHPVWISYTPR